MKRLILVGSYAGVVLFLAVGVDVAARVQAWAERPDPPARRVAITAAPTGAATRAATGHASEEVAAAELAAALSDAMTAARAQPATPSATPRPPRASRAACERLLDLRERKAIEQALALAPKKDRKARQRITRETRARIAAYQPETLAACAALPQTQVDCVLEAQDLSEQYACGVEVNRLLAE